MDAHERPRWPARRGGSSSVKALESLERTFIERLADRDPPPREQIEEVLNDILQGEEMFGRAAGKEQRLACLSWVYENWRSRQALKEVLAQSAQERAARAAQKRALASDEGTTIPPLDPAPSTDNIARPEAGELLAHDDEAELAELIQLTAEATELIGTIKTRLTQGGWPIFYEELARARDLVRMKASAEGVEMTERALRTAEIDLCRHKLEMIRASELPCAVAHPDG
jgi:hypothetical protein